MLPDPSGGPTNPADAADAAVAAVQDAVNVLPPICIMQERIIAAKKARGRKN